MIAFRALSLTLTFALLLGCDSAPRNYSAVRAYYNYDFTTAREQLRSDSLVNNEQVLLNNARLGMAALADGDQVEAERALGQAFDLLSTAGLNEDRTAAAVWVHEGVRIWKGEPFEQALLYYYVATQYAVAGDWENARAAASNALFRLTDFGESQTPEQLARKAARDDDYLETGYTAVKTNFALGFLMQAIGSKLTGGSGFDDQLNAALEINSDLEPVADRIRSGFDTLLIIDYGNGPTKISYGPDNALVKFQPQERHRGSLLVDVNGERAAQINAVCDVDQMAIDHRWNNLEDVRRAKSAIGDVLLGGGLAVTAIGGHENSLEAVLAGIGMMAAGALTKSGAKADTRYLEFAPQSIYIAPLLLEDISDLRVKIDGDSGSVVVLNDVMPGSTTQPRTIYLRVHGFDSPDPAWLTATSPIYSNNHTGVRANDYPYILGGRDVSTPTRETLAAYKNNGNFDRLTLTDLVNLYRSEEIFLGSGMDSASEFPRDSSYRHILDGGRSLFTPTPWSMGYKRLMFSPHRSYEPKSEAARNMIEQIRVQYRDDEYTPES